MGGAKPKGSPFNVQFQMDHAARGKAEDNMGDRADAVLGQKKVFEKGQRDLSRDRELRTER
jgi:hypothetical protein